MGVKKIFSLFFYFLLIYTNITSICECIIQNFELFEFYSEKSAFFAIFSLFFDFYIGQIFSGVFFGKFFLWGKSSLLKINVSVRLNFFMQRKSERAGPKFIRKIEKKKIFTKKSRPVRFLLFGQNSRIRVYFVRINLYFHFPTSVRASMIRRIFF